ncbi:unnamed protein product [Ixodes persulcatus]
MDTQEAPSEQEWRLVGSDQRLKDNITVVMKFTDGTALGTLPPDTIGNSVLQAAGLNSAERKDTFIKIRTIQNLIAIDTYRQSAAEKILRLQEVQMHGQTRSLIAYQASGKDTIKGVINGIQVSVPDEIIQRSLEVQGAKILQARRIASSKTILITLEGNRLPRYALYGRVVMRLYPYRPRSLFCHICAVIGHRADVCPNKPHFTTCLNCGTSSHRDHRKTRHTTARFSVKTVAGNIQPTTPNAQHVKRQTTLEGRKSATGSGANKPHPRKTLKHTLEEDRATVTGHRGDAARAQRESSGQAYQQTTGTGASVARKGQGAKARTLKNETTAAHANKQRLLPRTDKSPREIRQPHRGRRSTHGTGGAGG